MAAVYADENAALVLLFTIRGQQRELLLFSPAVVPTSFGRCR